jgi:hypothetical protein
VKFNKKWLLIAFLVVLGIFLFPKSVAGVGDETYVELLSNTDQCLTDCETVYKISAVGQNIKLDWNNAWFEFRDQKNLGLRDSSLVSGLKSWSLYVNDSRFVPKTCKENSRYSTTFVGVNGSVVTEWHDNISDTDCSYVEEYYRPFAPFDKTILSGQSVKLKIKGSKGVYDRVDNVLVLKIGNQVQKYTQWAWWDTDWQSCRQINVQNMAAGQTFNFFVDNSLLANVENANGDYASLRFVNGTCTGATGELNHWVEYWNPAANSSIWVNATSAGSSIAVFYDNDAASTVSNASKVFLFADDFVTNVGAWTNNNYLTHNGDSTANITQAATAYVYKDLSAALSYPFQLKFAVNRVATTKNFCVAPVTYGAADWASTSYDCIATDEAVAANILQVLEQNVGWVGTGVNIGANTGKYFVDAIVQGNKDIDTTWYNNDSINTTPNYQTITTFTNSFNKFGAQLVRLSGEDFTIPYDWLFVRQAYATETTITTIGSQESQPIDDNAPDWQVSSPVQNNTVFETTRQTFFVNVTWNTTVIADTNASFTWGGTTYTDVQSSIVVNSTGYNKTIYNISVNIPLQSSNATSTGHYWTVDIGATNTTRYTNTTTNQSQSINWAYYLSATTARNSDLIEGQTSYFNASLTKLVNNLAWSAINFTHNGTNRAGSIASNSSTVEVWGTSNTPQPLGNGTNINETFSINATAWLNYNGTTLSRLDFTNYTTQYYHKMVITDCSAGSFSITPAFSYLVYNEEIPTQAVSTNNEEQHVVSVTSLWYRTYGFAKTSRNNWTTCVYPTFVGANMTDNVTLTIGDGVTWASSTALLTQYVINATPKNLSVYATNLSGTNVAQITVTVEDTNGIVQPDLVVAVEKYGLANNTYYPITEDRTDAAGQFKVYLHNNDVFYRFTVYNKAKTATLYQTANIRIFGSTYTIVIGTQGLPGWDVFYALSQANALLTFSNATGIFSLDYNLANLPTGSYTLNEVCLRLDRESNTSRGNWTQVQLQCTSVTSGVLSTSAVTQSTADVWRAVAYANISSSPSEPYPLGILGHSFAVGIGLEGLFWGSMLVLVMSSIALFNPAAAVIIAVITLALLATTGVISGLTTLVVSVIVMGIIVMKFLRT